MRRRILVVSLAGALVIAGCAAPATTAPDPPPGDLEIHHIDVGQGDATLLIGPEGETMLIDTGRYGDNGTTVLDYLDEQNVDPIDHLVTTHPHADHIGGHEAVIGTYESRREGIGVAYGPGTTHTTNTYKEYRTAIERHDVQHRTVRDGDSIPFGSGVTVTVLHPPDEGVSASLNDASLTLLIEFGETEYLTTGDGEEAAESRLVRSHGDTLEADVYQAGHHGSYTSSSEALVDQIDPEVAVVSSAGASPHGHPHDSTLRRFDEYGIETYWTGAHGDTVITTDGREASVTVERDGPTDPVELLARKPIGGSAKQIGPTVGGAAPNPDSVVP
ncbi:MBL fold metallo-hydrolase [Halovenus sp. WSH3]|uniref:MBL fold metallo-hydrolase n=1 Tax=Halovenus carboxidivorans TaxID=2692199 RepID=A0A6B0T502_9EURY|nr:ComEC/Rec2 family competence protein [Halovenus carboxidivorans]MXR50613.1 MBL fold metallo-hydrolase [Halovenus carboxidivorans]